MLQLGIDRAFPLPDTRAFGTLPVWQRRHVFQQAGLSVRLLCSGRSANYPTEPQSFPQVRVILQRENQKKTRKQLQSDYTKHRQTGRKEVWHLLFRKDAP